jgi:hypothetical protein
MMIKAKELIKQFESVTLKYQAALLEYRAACISSSKELDEIREKLHIYLDILLDCEFDITKFSGDTKYGPFQ